MIEDKNNSKNEKIRLSYADAVKNKKPKGVNVNQNIGARKVTQAGNILSK